jgi:hypothetical protein
MLETGDRGRGGGRRVRYFASGFWREIQKLRKFRLQLQGDPYLFRREGTVIADRVGGLYVVSPLCLQV